jgi:TusA-related sulfurtransferase
MKGKVLDVRGTFCPQPALDTAGALAREKGDSLTVLSDRGAAEGNIGRAAERAGWVVESAAPHEGGGVSLLLRRKWR